MCVVHLVSLASRTGATAGPRHRTAGVPDAHPPHRIALSATDDELEELIGFVAAEANHEPNRRRRQRIDTACDALNDALNTRDR